MNKQWFFVFIAGLIEILWASLLKQSDSIFSYLGIVVLLIISFVMLLSASKDIPVATVYAAFTGIGTAGTVIVGILIYNESFDLAKLFFLCLLLTGILGLKLTTPKQATPKQEKNPSSCVQKEDL